MEITIKNAARCDRCGGKRQVANVSEAFPYDRRPHWLCLACAHEIVGALIGKRQPRLSGGEVPKRRDRAKRSEARALRRGKEQH